MWEVPVAAGIGAIGSILAGREGSDTAKKALKYQKKMEKQGREDLSPWRKRGKQALEELWKYIQDPSLVTEMPGYQFGLGEGTKALMRQASAMGKIQSGPTGKALQRYGQDYATTNWLNYLKPYQELSTVGQNAAARTAAMGTQYAGMGSQNILAGGGARVGAIGNLTNVLTSGLKDYYYMNQIERLNDLFSDPRSNWRNSQYNYLQMVK